MENNSQEQLEVSAERTRISRRTFVVSAAGACGAAALWSLHRSSVATVEAGTSNVSAAAALVFLGQRRNSGPLRADTQPRSREESVQSIVGPAPLPTPHAPGRRCFVAGELNTPVCRRHVSRIDAAPVSTDEIRSPARRKLRPNSFTRLGKTAADERVRVGAFDR